MLSVACMSDHMSQRCDISFTCERSMSRHFLKNFNAWRDICARVNLALWFITYYKGTVLADIKRVEKLTTLVMQALQKILYVGRL